MAISRRDFIVTGAATAATLSMPLWSRMSRAQTAGPKRNLILVLCDGGWDTTYAIDPRPNGLATVTAPPAEGNVVQRFEAIDVSTSPTRPSVAAYFERWAAVTAVVRGVGVRSIAHFECRKRMLTGSQSATQPDLAAVSAHELGADLPIPYLILGTSAFTGPYASSAARVGMTNQIKALIDPSDAYVATSALDMPRPVLDAADETAIRGYVTARAERVRATRGQLGYNRARIEDFLSSLERGDRLAGFSDALGARGVTLAYARQIDLAVDAIKTGLSYAVSVDSGEGWDTHQGNAQQDRYHESLFAGLTSLVDRLSNEPGKEAGHTMLDETVVAVLSEMGRTPLENANGGKDHWPVTSAMVIGGAVRGGRVFGGTTLDKMEAERVDLATGDLDPAGVTAMSGNFVAGMLSLVGTDPSPYLEEEPYRALIA